MVSHGYRGGPTLDYPSIEWEFTSMMFPIQIPSSWLTKTTRFPMLDTCSEPNLEVAKNPHRMCLRHCDMCSLSYNCWFKSSNPFFLLNRILVQCPDCCYPILLSQRPVAFVRYFIIGWFHSMMIIIAAGLYISTYLHIYIYYRWIDRQTSRTIFID